MFACLLLLVFLFVETEASCKTSSTLFRNITCLSNKFLFLSIDPNSGDISFGGNIKGEDGEDVVVGSITLDPRPSSVEVKDMGDYIEVESGYEDGLVDNMKISLSENDRFYAFETSTEGPTTDPIYRSFFFETSSITAFFEGGPVQMKDANKGEGHFYSEELLSRVYSLGAKGGDASETIPSRAADASVDIKFEDETQTTKTVIISGSENAEGSFLSGFKTVLIGDLLSGKFDVWGPKLESEGISTSAIETSSSSFKLSATNRDLPGLSVPADWDESSLPLTDLHSFLTGIYASPVGCLCTHKNQVEEGLSLGQIATTIARPDRGYSGTYNYFDPDNYISTSAILLSMDDYLQAEVKKVLLRNGNNMNKSTGQLPHHFEGANPVYQALSGEIQTGPNVFWVLSCFNYAKTSGDLEWLKSYMPTLRTATNFLYDLFMDDDIKLASVPGSLMVDVFLRSNYTSDTNAMLVGFFREFADAEDATGNSTGASSLRALADDISEALLSHLWDKESDDHFITQMNLDGTTRDFVDYDSNLMAVAHQVTNTEQAKRILARVDAGQCRKGVTFVSEVWYGEDDTTGGNTGDSWCAMGRHAWFDSLSRKLYDTYENFKDLILEPLQTHLVESTFMHERLACDGSQQMNRTAMYFEYPSVTAMITMKVKYGIEPGLTDFKVQPFYSETPVFKWEADKILVDFAPDKVILSLGRGLEAEDIRKTTVKLTKLLPSTDFTLKNNCEDEEREVSSGENGELNFDTVMGLKCKVILESAAE